MQVVDCKLVRNRRGLIVGEYTFRILAGTATGMLIKKRFTKKMCRAFAKELGFSNKYRQRKKSLPYFKEFIDIVGMRLMGLFDPELCVNGPSFWHMGCTSALKTYNKKLLKMRVRKDKDGFQCPNAYTHPCSKCHVGYDECPAGTHPRTYELHYCPGCQEENWFDPKLSRDKCIVCLTKDNLRTDGV